MNNKEHLHQLKNHSKSVALTNDEKKELLNNISTFVDTHTAEPSIESQIEFMPHVSFFGRKNMMMEYAAVCLIVLILTGGTSYAASYALPGDALYPLKVNVNEQVKGFFATD